jgi:type VI secretion system secreted protein VgrG
LSGQNLGGLNLAPGVYCFDSSAQLTGILTLVNPGGLSDPSWVFQINSALITASNSAVEIANIGSGEVFWQVGSSATLGTGTTFYGNILALTSITMDTGATIPCGRALAQNGAVTLDDNVLDNVCSFNTGSGGLSGSITPEPQLIMPLGVGIVGLALLKIKRTKAKAGESTI